MKNLLRDMPLFWKIYIFVVALLVFVVGMVEAVLEPPVKLALTRMYGGFQPWHEIILWGVSILLPSLACGYVISKVLSVKLESMVRASKILARGNLDVRLPVTGNDKDAFDMLARSFNDMAEAIKIQRQNGRRLLADISHELRSPLTRIAVAAGLLERGQTSPQNTAIALRLEKDVAQMNDMVSILLAQARDRIMLAQEAGPVDVSDLLNSLCDDFAFQGESRRLTLRAHVEKTLTAYGSAMQLSRMVGNILSNAVFYSPEGGVIELLARCRNDEISIIIRDFGPGVPENQLEDIFRAFYRVDVSRARTSGGAGLGLAMAREAAIQHGGNIRAENSGPGLRVIITLPAFEEDKHE